MKLNISHRLHSRRAQVKSAIFPPKPASAPIIALLAGVGYDKSNIALVACGIPLWRVAVFVNTLHPQIIGRRFIWRPGADVEISEGRFGLFDTPEFRENPVARVYATRTALRRRLADPDCAMDFPILQELR